MTHPLRLLGRLLVKTGRILDRWGFALLCRYPSPVTGEPYTFTYTFVDKDGKPVDAPDTSGPKNIVRHIYRTSDLPPGTNL